MELVIYYITLQENLYGTYEINFSRIDYAVVLRIYQLAMIS